jgi:hypothetical protein
MKQTIKFYVFAALTFTVIFKTACKEKNPEGYSKTPPAKRTVIDTTRIIAVFPTPEGNNIITDIAYKVRFDSVETLVASSNGLFKKLWHVDSVYWLPKLSPMIDSATKKPILDSTGRPRFRTEFVGPYKSDMVWDTGITADSANARFMKYLVVDTTKKK